MNIKYIIMIPIAFVLITSVVLTNYFVTFEQKVLKEQLSSIEKKLILKNRDSIKNNINYLINIVSTNAKYFEKLQKNIIKEKTISAIKLIDSIYEQNKNLPNQEIINKIKSSLDNISSLDKSKYFYIYKMDGTCLYLPANRKLEQKQLINLQDIKGQFVVQKMIKKLKKGDGFNQWYYTNPKTKKIEKKIGYAALYKPLNIFIGTAIYEIDIIKTLENYTKQLFKNFHILKKGHIFAYDYKGKTISNCVENLIDTNRWNYKLNGKFPIQELIKNGQKNNGSFIEYKSIINPESKIKTDKISYIRHIKELNWIVGTGFYTDKLYKNIKDNQEKLHSEFKKELNNVLLTVLLVVIVLILMLWYILNKVSNKLIISRNKLENSLHNFQQLIDAIMESIIITDNNRNIIDINNAGIKMLEFNNKNEIIGKSIFDFIPDYELEKLKRNIILDNVEPYEIDIKIKDKTLQTLSCGRNIIRDNKKIRISTIMDLTEMKIKNKMIQQQSKMATMGDMIGNIAHQWRQPLNVVGANIMRLELLNEMNYNDKEIQSISSNINKSLQYMSKTIDDFRNFFAINKDKDCFFIKEVIDEAKSILNTQLIDLDIELNIKNDCKKLEIYGYKNELLQVVLNILNNAKDAFIIKKDINDFDGKIVMDINLINDNIDISIHDNAGGIPKDIITKIFEPYFTTKFKSKGTGLGLYMSKMIIENDMNGTLYVSNDTHGANFTISIKNNNKENEKCKN